jgi:hypothetical protein
VALRQHVRLLVLGQELDIDTFAYGLPRPAEQRLLKFGKPALGCADEIGDGRMGLAHLGQHLVGRNAAIHGTERLLPDRHGTLRQWYGFREFAGLE